MSVFRKYDEQSKQWRPVASNDATTVYTANPVLTQEEKSKSVEEVLLADRNDIELLKKNVSWLAKHGGGGGGGYGGGNAAKATVQILSPNTFLPVSEIIWKENLQSIRVKIVSSYTGTYTVKVNVNGKQVYAVENVKRNTNLDIPASYLGISKNSVTMEVLAIDEAEMEYAATCRITVASVELQKPEAVTYTKNQLTSANPTINLSYRTSIAGDYKMYFSNTMITYNGNQWVDAVGSLDDRNQYVDMVGVGTTANTIKIPLVNTSQNAVGDKIHVLESGANPGIYSRYFVMVKADDPTICSSVQAGQINITITNGILVAPLMGVTQDNPMEISRDSILNLQFIAYSTAIGSYNYQIYKDGGTTPIQSSQSSVKYGDTISVPISMSIFDTDGEHTLTIKAVGISASAEANVYLKISQASTNYVKAYMQALEPSTIFDFSFWDEPTSSIVDTHTFVNSKYGAVGGAIGSRITQGIKFYNIGGDSGCNKVFYQMRHTCCSEIISPRRWFPITKDDSTSIINHLNFKFTVSIAYSIGLESNDNAIVFNLGNYKPIALNGDGSGFGIVVAAHGCYMRWGTGVLECDLSDDGFTQLDIVLGQNAGSSSDSYRALVYQNGILLKAVEMSQSTEAMFSDQYNFSRATIACRDLESKGNYYSATESIDMNLYSVKMYNEALNEGQIICGYINNYANYMRTADNSLDGALMSQLLMNNSINPDADVDKDVDGNYYLDPETTPTGKTPISRIFNFTSGTANPYRWGVGISGDAVNIGSLASSKLPVVCLTVGWTYSQFTSTSGDLEASNDCTFVYRTEGNQVPFTKNNVTVTPQGTTTLTYGIKNVDVTFNNCTFTPKDEWFPEQTFTLKADLVDSGHMNNATIGSFVNTCLNGGVDLAGNLISSNLMDAGEFPVASRVKELNTDNGGKMPPSMTHKVCIEGFPCVLIMNFLSESGSSRDVRVMGIYSFNLGRQSIVNQGFKVLKCLRGEDGNEYPASSFKAPMFFGIPQESDYDTTYVSYCFEGKRSWNNTSVSNVDINSNEYYDWVSVLTNPNSGIDSKKWSWYPSVTNIDGYVAYQGELVYDSSNSPIPYDSTHVKRHYMNPDGFFWSTDDTFTEASDDAQKEHVLWKPIWFGDNAENAETAFKTLNACVASKLPYDKGLYTNNGNKVSAVSRPIGTTYPVYTLVDAKTTKPTAKMMTITRPQAKEPLEISFKNSAFYYIVCMLFGLVDNFGKNMQVKSWRDASKALKDQKRWSPTFYDMDTALGIDNTGQQTIEPTVLDESVINTPDEKVAFMVGSSPQASNGLFTVYSNKLWGSLCSAETQNSYATDYGSVEEYDILAKMWSDLRTSKIVHIDEFLDSFLETSMSKCSELLYNYDYYVKYLNTSQIGFLNGSRISFIRNWLKDRIIFLDSVFGYKTLNENTYLTEIGNGTAPYIDPYNISWKNNIKLYHNSGTLAIPVVTNKSVIMKTVIGNDTQTYTYVPKNTTTRIPVATSLGTASINTMINNSDCITDIDMTSMDVYMLEPQMGLAVKSTKDNSTYYGDSEGGYQGSTEIFNQWGSFASLRTLNLRNADLTTDINYFKLFKTWDTSPYGYEPDAFKLQTINLSGVKSVNVTANLTGSTAKNQSGYPSVPNVYRSPFTNVTSIDISNSNISNVSIPEGVSLYNLNVTNSKLVNLTLQDQPLLPVPDFNGCNLLETIDIVNCARFTDVTFNTTTKSLRTIRISDCKNLTSITIDGGSGYVYLPAITISNCPNLKRVTVRGCNSKKFEVNPEQILYIIGCPDLENLSISDSLYKTVVWDGGQVLKKFKSLNLAGSIVGTLCTNNDPTSKDIDLRGFKSGTLTSLILSSNSSIKNIYFDNIEGKPFRIYTAQAFYGCSSLRRVYGNIELCASGIFANCSSFSIHGTNAPQYVVGGVSYPCTIGNAWQHPLDMGISTDDGCKFQEGEGVTNMKFGTANVSNMFQSTSCTTFDAYYMLWTLPSTLYGVTMDSTFRSSRCSWGWGDGWDNSPHRYMFARCGEVTSMQGTFHQCSVGGKFLSPQINPETGEREPGLFTPLKNMAVGYNLIFSNSATFVCDKNLFRTHLDTDGVQKYAWQYFRYFNPRVVVNDVNSLTYKDFQTIISDPVGNKEAHGNLSGFFTDMPHLRDSLYGVFNGTLYIDYDHFVTEPLNIPAGVVGLHGSLDSVYAKSNKDTFKLFNLFSKTDANGLPITESKLSYITNSIRASYESKDEGMNLNIELEPGFFDKMTNLTTIGFSTQGDYSSTSASGTSFYGAGVKKFMSSGTFPYQLLSGMPNLKNFIAFFYGCDMSGVIGGTDDGSILLPGTLFANNEKLEDVSYCFCNIKTDKPVILTGDSFANCPNIKNVSYMFGQTETNLSSIRQNPLPARFFYHGDKDVTKTIVGTDYTELKNVDTIKIQSNIKTAIVNNGTPTITTNTSNGITTNTKVTKTTEYTGFDSVYNNEVESTNQIYITPVTSIYNVVTTEVSTTVNGVTTNKTPVRELTKVEWSGLNKKYEYEISYKVYNRSLTNLTGCFTFADFKEYNWDINPNNVSSNNVVMPESNQDYNPFPFVYENGVWKRVTPNHVRYTYEWLYDGDREKYLQYITNDIVKGQIQSTFNPIIDGKKYNYIFTLPDDAWDKEWDKMIEANDYPNIDDMNNFAKTYCNKHDASYWGAVGSENASLGNVCDTEKFCLPPDLFRYCAANATINNMFAECGYISHRSGDGNGRVAIINKYAEDQHKAYGLVGRMCPYLLKPLTKLTSMDGLFKNCTWLGGYQKEAKGVFIIPESFFSYITSSSLSLVNTFQNWAFPANSNLNVFNFGHNITLNLKQAFYRALFSSADFSSGKLIEGVGKDPNSASPNLTYKPSTTINGTFIDDKIYVRSMQACFANSMDVSAGRQDYFKRDQNVMFNNVFKKYDKNNVDGDYYVFCGYTGWWDNTDNPDDVTVVRNNQRFANKTINTDFGRYNYFAEDSHRYKSELGTV